MGFTLGARSRAELKGVHPRLVAVVERAIKTTRVDFTVTDGLRTRAEQERLVRTGASKTMNSRHLLQADGTGHAVDLVPWENGKPRWEWKLVYPVAEAVRDAALVEGVVLRWGGVWDRLLLQLPGGAAALEREVAAYQVRHPGPDFLDGPHYELVA